MSLNLALISMINFRVLLLLHFLRPPAISSGGGRATDPSHSLSHLRDCSTGSIGYSYEVRPTFRLLPWAISPTHYTTRTQLTVIDSIGQRRLRQCMPYCIRPRLRYYKRSYSFNPQSRFPDHSAESTGGLHRPNGILSRMSKTLTPWLAAPRPGIEPCTHEREETITGLRY